MSSLSAGPVEATVSKVSVKTESDEPLISKFRKRQFARKRSRLSSMMSGLVGSSKTVKGDRSIHAAGYAIQQRGIPDIGAGPRTFVLMGRIATFPIVETDGSSI